MSGQLAPRSTEVPGIDLATFVSAAEVEAHNREVGEACRRRGSGKTCRRCRCDDLRLHELRRRGLRTLERRGDRRVVVLLSVVLARLRCARCWATFTDHPPFVRPCRRYAADVIETLARQQLEDGARSLAQGVGSGPDGRAPTGYDVEPKSKLDGCQLHRSTLLLWLVWLGCQPAALALAMAELLDHDPAADCHRLVGDVDPRRFRSPRRGAELRQARRLLQVAQSWRLAFSAPLFPRLATRAPPG